MRGDFLFDLLLLLFLRFLIRIRGAAGNRTPPNDPASKSTPQKESPKTEEETQVLIKVFDKSLREQIKKYLRDNPQLPTWPDKIGFDEIGSDEISSDEMGSDEIGEHIAGLRLPATSISIPSSPQPG